MNVARRLLVVALGLAALAGCGGGKSLPPSNLPVLVPSCHGGRGPALSDRARDVTFHAFPGRRVRVAPPPPAADILRGAVTVTKQQLCVTVKTSGGTPPTLQLIAREKDNEDSKLWTLTASRGGSVRFARGDASPNPVPGVRVARRGPLTEVAVALSEVSDGPFDGDFEWQMNTQENILGPGGRPPAVAQQVDCLTKSNAWARFPQGTTVRRPLQPGSLGPGCVP